MSTGSLVIDAAGGIVTDVCPANVIRGLAESASRENDLSMRVVAGRVPLAGTLTVDSVKVAFPMLAAAIDKGSRSERVRQYQASFRSPCAYMGDLAKSRTSQCRGRLRCAGLEHGGAEELEGGGV